MLLTTSALGVGATSISIDEPKQASSPSGSLDSTSNDIITSKDIEHYSNKNVPKDDDIKFYAAPYNSGYSDADYNEVKPVSLGSRTACAVYSQRDFKAALSSGKVLVLKKNITLTESNKTWALKNKSAIKLNGYKLTIKGKKSTISLDTGCAIYDTKSVGGHIKGIGITDSVITIGNSKNSIPIYNVKITNTGEGSLINVGYGCNKLDFNNLVMSSDSNSKPAVNIKGTVSNHMRRIRLADNAITNSYIGYKIAYADYLSISNNSAKTVKSENNCLDVSNSTKIRVGTGPAYLTLYSINGGTPLKFNSSSYVTFYRVSPKRKYINTQYDYHIDSCKDIYLTQHTSNINYTNSPSVKIFNSSAINISGDSSKSISNSKFRGVYINKSKSVLLNCFSVNTNVTANVVDSSDLYVNKLKCDSFYSYNDSPRGVTIKNVTAQHRLYIGNNDSLPVYNIDCVKIIDENNGEIGINGVFNKSRIRCCSAKKLVVTGDVRMSKISYNNIKSVKLDGKLLNSHVEGLNTDSIVVRSNVLNVLFSDIKPLCYKGTNMCVGSLCLNVAVVDSTLNNFYSPNSNATFEKMYINRSSIKKIMADYIRHLRVDSSKIYSMSFENESKLFSIYNSVITHIVADNINSCIISESDIKNIIGNKSISKVAVYGAKIGNVTTSAAGSISVFSSNGKQSNIYGNISILNTLSHVNISDSTITLSSGLRTTKVCDLYVSHSTIGGKTHSSVMLSDVYWSRIQFYDVKANVSVSFIDSKVNDISILESIFDNISFEGTNLNRLYINKSTLGDIKTVVSKKSPSYKANDILILNSHLKNISFPHFVVNRFKMSYSDFVSVLFAPSSSNIIINKNGGVLGSMTFNNCSKLRISGLILGNMTFNKCSEFRISGVLSNRSINNGNKITINDCSEYSYDGVTHNKTTVKNNLIELT